MSEIFEAEVKMEKQSSVLPLLLLLSLMAAVLGVVAYVVLEIRARQPLSTKEAGSVVESILKAQGPAVIHFHGGLVMPSVDEKPRDPHYRLLEKAGVVKTAKAAGGGTMVTLTPVGERLASIPGFKKWKNADRTTSYAIPLAERQLVEISSITMTGVNDAAVQYTWKWVPNQLGDDLDAAGKLVKSFNTWDRATLIEKYGADFYHGDPTRASVNLVRTDKGWKVATE
ncbi:MAG TPA: hypothetical protein VKR26_04475 [Terriglobales bacterium]|jgi:hypothetical protein|nr:hypothetical protein [Terriglobales bacterium]